MFKIDEDDKIAIFIVLYFILLAFIYLMFIAKESKYCGSFTTNIKPFFC